MAFKTVIAEMPVYYPGMPEYLGGERYIAQITVEDAGFTKYYPEDEPLKCFRFFLKAVGKTIPFVETCKINAKVFKKDVIPEATRILNELGLKTSTWKRVYKKASNPRRRKAKRNTGKYIKVPIRQDGKCKCPVCDKINDFRFEQNKICRHVYKLTVKGIVWHSIA